MKRERIFPILASLVFLAPLLVSMLVFLFGCGASGHASGGNQSMERKEEKPTTRDIRVTGPADKVAEILQSQVFKDLWAEHPPEKFGGQK